MTMFRLPAFVVDKTQRKAQVRTVMGMAWVDTGNPSALRGEEGLSSNGGKPLVQQGKRVGIRLIASKFGHQKIVSFGNPDAASKARAVWEKFGYTVSQAQ